jgi:glyoxylase-like metal-dependent hydrolase (beta-lactamase superfamily II)
VITSLDEALRLAATALEPEAPTYEVLAVRYGTRMTSRAAVYHGYEQVGEPDRPLRMDYFFWLLRRDAGTILVDCGFEPAVGERRGRTTLVAPLEALDRLGVSRDSLESIVVTHLHYDHTGALDAFPSATLVVQRRDLEFWSAPGLAAEHAAHVEMGEVAFVADAVEAGRARVLDGAAIVAPGVAAILVGGHSPGQQSLVVKGEQGAVLLTSDAIHYDEEAADPRLQFAIFTNLEEMVAGYGLLQSVAERTGAALVPGHEPAVAERFPPAEGDLRPGAVLRLG